jgi:hypothetical protein
MEWQMNILSRIIFFLIPILVAVNSPSCFAQSPYETLNDSETNTKISLYSESCSTISSSAWTRFIGAATFEYWRVYRRFNSYDRNIEVGCYIIFNNGQLNLYKLNEDALVKLNIEKLRGGATSDEVSKKQRINDVPVQVANQQTRSSVSQPTQNTGGGKVIGSTFDSEANGNIFLYDGACQLPNFSSNYPMRWDAKRADNGAFIGEGCYSVNQQSNQVFIIASTGKTASLPMSAFQGGGGENKSFFQSFAEGLQRATTYWNNSANETQRNTTNLTPGLTGGNRMNCTPDGRGGYNCR